VGCCGSRFHSQCFLGLLRRALISLMDVPEGVMGTPRLNAYLRGIVYTRRDEHSVQLVVCLDFLGVDSNDYRRLLTAVDHGVDHPIVSGICHAASFHGATGLRLHVAQKLHRSLYIGVSYKRHA